MGRVADKARRGLRLSSVLLVALLMLGVSARGAALIETTSAAGTLSVASEPAAATVYVDGELRGETPLSLEGLSPGDHRVKLVKEGYLENSRVLSLKTDRPASVEVTLTPSAGQPRNAMQIQTQQPGGGSKLPLILAIAGGGAAVAYFALRSTNDPPVPGGVSVSPSGTMP